jgi:hypothetical protein
MDIWKNSIFWTNMSVNEKDFINSRFKFNGKCKVCKIVHADSDLFTKIHKLRFLEEYSLSSLIDFLREKFIEKKFSILLPNEVNLARHFKKHIPIELVAAYTTLAKKNALVKVAQNDVLANAKQGLYEIVDERIAVYSEMEKHYKKFELMVQNWEKEFDNKISIDDAPQYTLLIRELKSFLVEMAKMSANEQLVKVILSTAFQKYTLGALQSIVKECDLFKLTLRSYIKDTSEIESMISGHQTRLYDGLSSSSKEAIELVKDQYKIN